jgi:hypothetical protein
LYDRVLSVRTPAIEASLVMAVCSAVRRPVDCGTDVLDCLEPSLSRVPLVSLMLKSLCSWLVSVGVRFVLIRVSLLSPRPIVLPAVLPTVPRASVFDWRTPAALPALIVLPIRVVDPVSIERGLVADCSLVIGTDCSFPPIKLPMLRLRSVRSVERLLFDLGSAAELVFTKVEGLFPPKVSLTGELTAGCFACLGAEEFCVPNILPILERRLAVESFSTFERDD